MMVNVRKRYNEEVAQELKKPDTEAVLKQNTIRGRMAELRAEADDVRRKLASRSAKERDSAMERSKAVLGEYVFPKDPLRKDAACQRKTVPAGAADC